MSNYKIIQDEKAFKEFIEWLPKSKDGEQFYYSLFARKKYAPDSGIKADKGQLKRGTATKERLFQKIKQLEIEVGGYDVGGIEAPQESLALYITPNPRSMKKASQKTRNEINKLLDNNQYSNPKSIALNAIQVSRSRTVFIDFDFDVTSPNFYHKIYDSAHKATGNEHSFEIVRTRGGYHLLVRPEETIFKSWYQEILKIGHVDQKGDLLLPVVGCTQGGFTPKFI